MKLTHFIKNLLRRYFEHEVGQSGGAIAYFSLLSVFPFIIYTNTLLTYINVSEARFISFISSLLPPEIAEFLDIYIADIAVSHTPGILFVSIFATFYSTSRVVRSFEHSINRAYDSPDRRGFFRGIVTSALFTVCLVITVIASIILTTVGEKLVMFVLSFRNAEIPSYRSISILKWIFTGIIMFLAVSSFYYYMPTNKVSYKSILPGTVTSMIGLSGFSVIFNIYIRFAAGFSVIYSSIGAVFLLVFWLYFAGIILVMGAEINAAIAETKNPLRKS
ncbi:MAG: YihY/virulence factor BrkB family protein [Clostridia bacterium]|nr:YihY/virulence factor BrkB family protein [Clostridia bacterium]MBR2972982.1 YihY/virulence factor BrkB family protein [Clostridia bacterium]